MSGVSGKYFSDSMTFEEMENILRLLPANIYLKDAEGRYIFCTQYWRHLRDRDKPGWSIRGKTDVEIREDKENAMLAMEKDREIIRSGRGCRYVIEIFQNGVQEFLEIVKEPVKDSSGNVVGIVGLINDVTESEKIKRKLSRLAMTDSLTGLGNRNSLMRDLERLTEDSMPVSIVSADCDGLQMVNDTYGRATGDEYIRMTAMVMELALPEDTMVYRVGGDEFIIVLVNTDENEAKEIMRIFKEQYDQYRVKNQPLSISYGISTAVSVRDDLRRVLEKADLDMCQRKQRRRSVL
ncbi:diguanylate cyclase domain-containing protein [Anaerovibrio sp.]|uniref:sensor domain-containing diguanylate cyclase n=1 Tax=Anaerovibrio sp. TaxID=1872532 RepID=UPI003F15F12C